MAITLDEARQNVDRKVVYTPIFGAKEEGVITSVSPSYVFVRFDDQHPTADGKACDPDTLDFVVPATYVVEIDTSEPPVFSDEPDYSVNHTWGAN